MKRIVIIFFILIGIYLIYTLFQNFPSFKNGQYTTSKISDHIKDIDIDIGALNVEIIPENRDNVEVDFEGKGKVKVNERRNSIEITQEAPMFTFFSFFNFKRGEMIVYIPEEYNRRLEIDLGSGSVTLDGNAKNPYKLEELSIDMGSGTVELNNLIVDQFSYNVGSGNVAIDSLETKKGDFDVSSGNVRINNYVGAIDADISSGRLQIHVKELKDFINIDVSSGTVDLDLPDDADFSIIGNVSSGKINYDFPLTLEEQSGKKFRGRYNSGKYPIDIDVSSGTVKVY